MRLGVVWAASVALVSGCGRDAAPRVGDGELRVSVGALALPGISDARFTLRVVGAGGVVVWSSSDLTSARYGTGRGDLAYVAPCDSTLNPHTVELSLDALWAGGLEVDAGDWARPGVLARTATCVPNGDVAVAFDIVLARSAEQGFFDVAVTFDDIFCSAKLDCTSDLLHNELDERDQTVVLGFACAAGVGQPTFLHMTDVRVVCDDGQTTWVSPTGRDGAPGNMGARPPAFFQTAVYWGQESVVGADKCYWNLALGLEQLTSRCVLEGAATATSMPLVDGHVPNGMFYPYVKWQVPLSSADGTLTCGQHALDAPGSGVATAYTQASGGAFQSTLTCADPPSIATPPRLACDGRIGVVGGSEAVTVSQDIAGVSLSVGAARSRPYTLPKGYDVDACCLNACCVE